MKVQKKGEPKKFYIAIDEYNDTYLIGDNKVDLAEEMETNFYEAIGHGLDEVNQTRVFEAVELKFEVTQRPSVEIQGVK